MKFITELWVKTWQPPSGTQAFVTSHSFATAEYFRLTKLSSPRGLNFHQLIFKQMFQKARMFYQ